MPESEDPASRSGPKQKRPLRTVLARRKPPVGPEARRATEPPTEPTEPPTERPTPAGTSGADRVTEVGRSKAPWLELPYAWISYLRTELNRQRCRQEGPDSCDRAELVAGADRHLALAEAAYREEKRLFTTDNRRERIWANVRAADVNVLALSSDDELRARCGQVMEMVQTYLHEGSPQRVRAERVYRKMAEGGRRENEEAAISPQDRATMVQALRVAYAILDTRSRRVRLFANILWLATALTLVGAAGIALWGALDPQTLNLCFPHPEKTDLISDGAREGVVVCPTGEHVIGDGRFAGEYADRMDVLSVELAGLVGATLTTIAALRRTSGDYTSPHALPLAVAMLKFPLGAIAAFIGVLFIRGAFLPGLSALDTPTQIIAWAVIFGAAQQLVTHLIDQKAQTTLSGVRKPPGPPERTPTTER
ncbi:hypothetical protein ACTWP5_16580 [Streptomyces sp. 4N509B]|uniref:hypothetical protein n=1 Tax=Streptomyces sp. 4N509B TaxID=3457413 RepID=UPI003FD3E8F3